MHENHRERMRQRYMQCGSFDSFSTPEILEMILYSSVPRGDTNETAHRLLEQFGSLRGLLEASTDELQTVQGVGPQSAILLKAVIELTRRYAMEQSLPCRVFDTVSKIADYFCRLYIGIGNERLYMMLLDNRMSLIDCSLISEGTVNAASAPIRLMVERAYFKRASAVVLAHNHPGGVAIPSSSDVEITERFNDAFQNLGITLVEHVIVADDRYCAIMKQHFGTFRRSPVSGKIECGFYDQFYDVDAEQWQAKPIFEE